MTDPVKITPLPPVPSLQPFLADQKAVPITVPWNQWFVQVREKINLINAILAAFSSIVTSGFVVINAALGTAYTRTITGTAGEIGVSNGDGLLGNPTLTLVATGVMPGTYGDATNVAQVTVDVDGRITSAVDVPISFPAGATWGSITGTITNQTDLVAYVAAVSMCGN